MMSEQASRRRWFVAGCVLTVLMGLGATLAVFSLKRP